jgi:recombination protein RecR
MQFPSKLVEHAVAEFAKLPGIGKRSALRMTLHLLKLSTADVQQLSETLMALKNGITQCQECYSISDTNICTICNNYARNKKIVCVVESFKDVLTIENTQHFNGKYHVLGGLISPLDGIGPDQLNIEPLIKRIIAHEIEEIIFALNPNIQGDTTIYYIQKQLKDLNCYVSTIARGIAFGGELEYADEMTLARSLQNRLPVQQYVK